MQKTKLEKNTDPDFPTTAYSSSVSKWLQLSKSYKRNGRTVENSSKTVGVIETCAESADCDLSWAILKKLPDGLIVSDSARRIVFANDAAKRLLGLTSKNAKQQLLLLPECGAITINTNGEQRTVEVSSRSLHHKGRNLTLSTLRDATPLFQQLERLSYQCFTDELTGLYNRRGFLATASHQIESARRNNRRVMIIFADVDGLKSINDSLGHAAGDSLIADVSNILKCSLRGADIIARIGGDEFVILTTIENGGDTETVIERLRSEVNAFNEKKLRDYFVSVSFGISMIEPDADVDLGEVIRRADMEMYREKRRRRAC